MDWSLLLIFLALLLVGGTASFYLRSFVVRTRKEFRAQQPTLRITNLSALNSGNVLTLIPELENVGRGVAYDCMMHLGGWEGSFAVKKLYPQGPRHQTHAATIVVGPDAPLRTTPQTNGSLRLSYQDCWGLRYECWYPVTQVQSVATPLYNVHIDLAHPELTEPHPSFRDMRTFLRNMPSPD